MDKALRELGLVREVTTVVPTFLAAVLATLRSDLVAAVPEQLAVRLRPSVPLHVLSLPMPLPTMSIAQAWHPRLDADPAHRWLRACVKAACAE